MALKLSSKLQNFTSAMFLSADCFRMCTVSTSPCSSKIPLKTFSLQIYFFREETCSVLEGALMVMDLVGVNLSILLITDHRSCRSRSARKISFPLA